MTNFLITILGVAIGMAIVSIRRWFREIDRNAAAKISLQPHFVIAADSSDKIEHLENKHKPGTCRRCGADRRTVARFCYRCGESLELPGDFTPFNPIGHSFGGKSLEQLTGGGDFSWSSKLFVDGNFTNAQRKFIKQKADKIFESMDKF